MNTKEYLKSFIEMEANFNVGYNEKIVERLLSYDLTYPLDFGDLLTQCDIELVIMPEISEAKGRIIFNNNRYTFITSKTHGEISERYVQATLLARLIFEQPMLEAINYYYDQFICDGSGGRIVTKPHNYKMDYNDKRANIFAQTLLMPKTEVVEFLNEQKVQASECGEKVYQRDFIDACAKYYLLSELAVINQLKKNGIISQE